MDSKRDFCFLHKGFTMAEVLITLGIIGIVAAMTLPSVINKHKRVESETRLKKAYTVLNQAVLSAQAKHGEMKDWPEWDDGEEIIRKYIAPEIKGAKIFPKGHVATAMCYENKNPIQNIDESAYQYTWMDKIHISNPFTTKTASIKLQDGTCIGINGANAEGYNLRLFIDTNGSYRLPNKAGYDLFFFTINGNQILPEGSDWALERLSSQSITGSCNTKASRGGRVCAAKIIGDGWSIKYW